MSLKKTSALYFLAALAASCAGADAPARPPAPRAPEPHELHGRRLEVRAAYPAGTPSPWGDWSGALELELLAPTASEPAPPARASLGEGLTGGCLGGLEGSWTYDPATASLVAILGDGSNGTLTLSLVAELHWERPVGEADRDGAPGLVSVLTAVGTWEVALLGDCDGDFAGGTVGVAEASEAEGSAPAALVGESAQEGETWQLLALALDGEGSVSPVYRRVR